MTSRTNLQKRFQLFEYRTISDWWDLGLTLKIRWIGNEDYVEWSEAKDAKTPRTKAQEEYGDALTKGHMHAGAMTVTMRAGSKKDDEYTRALDSYLKTALMGMDISIDKVIETEIAKLTDSEGVARFILYDIGGLKDADTDEPIEYTPEVGLDIIFKDDPHARLDAHLIVPEPDGDEKDELYIEAGTMFSAAFRQALIWEASRTHMFNVEKEGAKSS